MIAHLHGGLCYSRYLLPILFEVRKIAADEDLGMTAGVQRIIHQYASPFVRLKSKQLTKRRGLYPGRPQGNHSIDPLTCGDHIARLDVGDGDAGMDLDAESGQLLDGLPGEILGIRGENARTALE